VGLTVAAVVRRRHVDGAVDDLRGHVGGPPDALVRAGHPVAEERAARSPMPGIPPAGCEHHVSKPGTVGMMSPTMPRPVSTPVYPP
jgi:hypothetical protein